MGPQVPSSMPHPHARSPASLTLPPFALWPLSSLPPPPPSLPKPTFEVPPDLGHCCQRPFSSVCDAVLRGLTAASLWSLQEGEEGGELYKEAGI